jgi:hypothetical protein
VRKHIGDYALFFAGMFPESINHFRLRRHRLENFVEWMKAGKESYHIVSKFEHFEYAKVAPLFANLSREFEAASTAQYGEERSAGDAAPDRAAEQRTAYVDSLRSGRPPMR